MSKSVRLSLDVSRELHETIEKMARETNGSKSDVLRKSIVLFELAINEKKKHNHIGVFDEGNKIIKEIVGI